MVGLPLILLSCGGGSDDEPTSASGGGSGNVTGSTGGASTGGAWMGGGAGGASGGASGSGASGAGGAAGSAMGGNAGAAGSGAGAGAGGSAGAGAGESAGAGAGGSAGAGGAAGAGATSATGGSGGFAGVGQAAHAVGQSAVPFDGGLGHAVYPLSDSVLCPSSASHQYSYTNQFSVQGDMTFSCAYDASNANLTNIPVYDKNFTLVFKDAVGASGLAAIGSHNFKQPQFSQVKRVLYAQHKLQIYQLDPWNGTGKVYADFAGTAIQKKSGTSVAINTIRDFKVGPGDVILVELGATAGSINPGSSCPSCFVIQGEGVFDPATGKIYKHAVNDGEVAAWPKVTTAGFDETNLTQDSPARVFTTYNKRPVLGHPLDLSSTVTFLHPVNFPQITQSGGVDPKTVSWSAHGHMGFFCGSNGKCYAPKPLNDVIDSDLDGTPDKVGQIGVAINGKWRSYEQLVNTKTGQVELVWGQDSVEQGIGFGHFSRSLAKDVFWASDQNQPITRCQVSYDATGKPIKVSYEKIALPKSTLSCGYWALPRVNSDATGERALFDAANSACKTHVYVTVR